MSEYEWVQCPVCENPTPTVERNIGDRGSTESLTIICDTCDSVRTVTP